MRVFSSKPIMDKLSKMEKEINQLKVEVKKLNDASAKTSNTSNRSLKTLQKKLDVAHKAGVTTELFYKHSGWLLADNKMGFILLREKYVREITAKSGLTDDEVIKLLAKGRSYGITGEQFVKYNAHLLTDDELLELKDAIVAYNAKQVATRKWYLDVVMERTGWDEKTAKDRMKFARTKGYNGRKFITEALYKLTEEELKNVPKYVKKTSIPTSKEAIQKAAERKAEYRRTIKDEMGWNDAQLDLAFLKAHTASGASFSEYFLFGLYKLTPEEGKQYMTMETHIKMQLRYIDFKGTQPYFENKTLFNTHFSEFVKRRWFNNDNLTFEEFTEKIEGLNKIIYKPVEGIEGIGIAVYDVNESPEQNRAVYNEIMENGPANIEEFLIQNAELSEFWPNSVNTIRIMTICKEGKGNILNAVIKFGTRANVDNYYQGGIAAGIDINTGEICTHGVNNTGILFESHPYSNKPFKGFKIPNWDKVVETCKAASCKIPEMPYVGWDIAINGKGEPEIIEGNHNQGAYLIQYSFAVSNKEGRRHTIDPYLWFE